MSKKSTKIIAVAGVVAGLGVAALPALTFARSVDGAVKLEAEVLPSIAMTIVSNSDNSAVHYNDDPEGSATGYGITGTRYTKDSESGEFTNWSSATTSLLPNDTDDTMNSIVTVYTNNAAGYTLVVKDEDEDNSLRKDSSNNIAAIVTPSATLTPGSAAWGIKGGDLGTTYTAIPASTATDALTLKANGSAAGAGEATTFTYGVATAATQATGTYEDVIVYTATTK